jgi:methyl-accepting chemotaxis protein
MDEERQDSQSRANAARDRGLTALAVAVTIAIPLLSGCGEQTYTFLGTKRTPREGLTTKEELTAALDNFEEYAAALRRETSSEIQKARPDEKIKRSDLIRNVRLTQAFSTMLEQRDPIVAFLETWGLTVRLRLYFEVGQGSTLYGDYQELVIDRARQLELKIENIGRRFLTEDEFRDAQTLIRRFAEQNPVRESFSNLVVYATQARPGEPSPFSNVLAIPMAPFTALKGVDRTASAIHSVRGSMDHIADVVERTPESARWELMLLLTEMEDTAIIKSLLSSASTLSESSARFADTAEKLPEELREQVSVLVKDIDERQANIQATLDKAEETTAALERTLVAAKGTIEAAGQTAQTINESAREWESAVGATSELIGSVRQWSESRPEKDPNAADPAKEYQATAQAVTESATELRALLAEAQDLLGSKSLTVRIEDVNSRAAGLIDRVFWRLMQLAAAIVILVAACRLVFLRLSAKRTS